MATIKSYTDLEQSKKLAEILPPESADMSWCNSSIKGINYTDPWRTELKTPIEIESIFNEAFVSDWKLWWKIIPCWSQAALYNILPVIIGNLLEKNALRLRMDKGETNFNVWYDNLDTGCVEDGLDVVESNPVDAYFQMILMLKEKNLL